MTSACDDLQGETFRRGIGREGRETTMKHKEFEAISRELLCCMPGFQAKDHLLFRAPVGDMLRGICFERSEIADVFYVSFFFLPLFMLREYISFEFGDRLRRSSGQEAWKRGMDGLIPDLRRMIEREVLSFVSKVNTAADVVREAEARLHYPGPHYLNTLAYALARAGQTKRSLAAFDRLLVELDPGVFWQNDLGDEARRFKVLLETDPDQAQRQLDAWTDESLRNLRLEKYR